MPDEAADRPVPERPAEDDHDLLTYGEAGVRLHEEAQAVRSLLASLEASGEAEEAERARRRLAALEEALDRNHRQPINDDNFESFFGYKGTARRNT
jgi:hypothetical protein